MTNKTLARLGKIVGTVSVAHAAPKVVGWSLLLRGCDGRGSRVGHNTNRPQMKSQFARIEPVPRSPQIPLYHLASNIPGAVTKSRMDFTPWGQSPRGHRPFFFRVVLKRFFLLMSFINGEKRPEPVDGVGVSKIRICLLTFGNALKLSGILEKEAFLAGLICIKKIILSN